MKPTFPRDFLTQCGAGKSDPCPQEESKLQE